MPMPIVLSDAVSKACPGLRLGLLTADVTNGETVSNLTAEIEAISASVAADLDKEPASTRPEIAATRRFYKALGKDPSRYRPSAEALTRRALQGKGLYQVSNAVDVTNLISLKTGLSIGAYDLTKIDGAITMRAGTEGEPYQAIGRGELNIAHLPVFADETGAFGSPTSDSARTCLDFETTKLLMVLICCGPATDLPQAIADMRDALERYCQAQAVETQIQTNAES